MEETALSDTEVIVSYWDLDVILDYVAFAVYGSDWDYNEEAFARLRAAMARVQDKIYDVEEEDSNVA